MPPPRIHNADEDDLDDLDDVLDSLTTTQATASTSTAGQHPLPPSNAPPPPAPAPATATSSTSSAADFPDPEEDTVPDPDDVDLDSLVDPELARELEQGMKALLAGLGPEGDRGQAGGVPGLEDADFAKLMQEMLKGDFGAAGLGADSQRASGNGGGDDELQKLMAALGMNPDDLGLPSQAAASVASTSGAAAARGPTASSSDAPPTTANAPPAAPPANFQDAIAASMSKLRDSSTTANASRAASSSGAGAGMGDSAGMAAMLAQLAGMPGGAAGLEGLDSDEGLQGMLDDMMKQLMSREMLYEPLKELADKYPAYLSAHSTSLATADRERYEKQRVIVCEIVAAFEEPGADVDPAAKLSADEEQKRVARTERVVDLVAKMNECGAPPTEIMGEMPPGMELGPDGAPKVPECCIA
ncbi:hypothetical protein JCM3774_004945 [Rhodotorula dairenensis]